MSVLIFICVCQLVEVLTDTKLKLVLQNHIVQNRISHPVTVYSGPGHFTTREAILTGPRKLHGIYNITPKSTFE